MTTQDERRKRLADALRDNLKRRKAQDRHRRNSAAEAGHNAAAEARPHENNRPDMKPHAGAQE